MTDEQERDDKRREGSAFGGAFDAMAATAIDGETVARVMSAAADAAATAARAAGGLSTVLANGATALAQLAGAAAEAAATNAHDIDLGDVASVAGEAVSVAAKAVGDIVGGLANP